MLTPTLFIFTLSSIVPSLAEARTSCYGPKYRGRDREHYYCPKAEHPTLTGCCVHSYWNSGSELECCLPEGNPLLYLWNWHPWLYYWLLGAFVWAVLWTAQMACSNACRGKSEQNFGFSFPRRLWQWFMCSCCWALPCLWCPVTFLVCWLVTEKCLLCEENIRLWKLDHSKDCKVRNKALYDAIPNSSLYSCANCVSPLKMWPKEKLAVKECEKCPPNIARITNSDSNLHYCFLCDKCLCSRHSAFPDRRVIITWTQSELRNLVTLELEDESILMQPLKT